MKSILPFIALIISTFSAHSQAVLHGTISIAETGEPLPGAHVYFPDLQRGGTTDLHGYYRVENLPQGTFLVDFGYVAHSSQVKRVMLSGETRLDVALEPSITEMSEFVITGISQSTERKLSPVPTTIIENPGGGETAATNIIDAVAGHPGISQITTGSAVSKPVIRGLGYNRVVVLENGIRQEGQQWGDEHGIEVDEYSVDRVEIIKGPGSLMYGSDAMAGVIHLIPPKPVERGKIVGSLLGNYQSNNNLQGYSAMTAGHLNGFDWRVQGSGKLAGNYRNAYDGRVYNSGFEELNFNASVGLNKAWGYTRLRFSKFSQTLGVVEGERDSAGYFVKHVESDAGHGELRVDEKELSKYGIDVPFQEVNHWKVTSSTRYFFENSRLGMNLAFQQNDRKEFHDFGDKNAAELHFLLNTFNYDLRYQMAEWDGWKPSMGVGGMWQKSYNRGEEVLIPEYGLFDAGLFVHVQKNFGDLHLSGGLRYDYRILDSNPLYLDENEEPITNFGDGAEIKFEDFSTSYSNISAAVGASHPAGERSTVKLNLSRGFRAPNMAELGSNGVHEGTFRYEIGNSDLKAETSLQLDAGFEFDGRHLSFELSLFGNAISNYISLERLGEHADGPAPEELDEGVEVYGFVQDDARLYGGEVLIDLHPHPWHWLHFENSFSFVRGVKTNVPDSAENLAFMPAPRFKSELRANFSKVGSRLAKVYIGVNVSHHFAQNHVLSLYETETPTGAYTLLNAGLGADIIGRNDNRLFTISLAATNLLDTAFQNHLSRLKYAPLNVTTGRRGVFDMGRNISVKVQIPLTFRG